MVDGLEFYNPTYATFVALSLQRTVWRCHKEVFNRDGFSRIQKAVMNNTGRIPPNSHHSFLLGQILLWKVLWNFVVVQPLSLFSSIGHPFVKLFDYSISRKWLDRLIPNTLNSEASSCQWYADPLQLTPSIFRCQQ